MATIAIGHYSHLLLKCRVANYKSLAKSTVLVGSSKFGKIVFFDQLFGFSNIAFIIPSHFIIVLYFTHWMLEFFNTTGCQTVWIQIRPNTLSGLM